MFQPLSKFIGEYIEESMHCETPFDFDDFRMYMLHGYRVVVPDNEETFNLYLRILSSLN